MKDRIHEYLLEEMSQEDRWEFEKAMVKDPELRKEVNDHRKVIQIITLARAIPSPPSSEKSFFSFLAMKREKKIVGRPPILHPGSKAEDYEPWLSLPEMVPPDELKELYFIPFADNEDGMSAVVWIPGLGFVPEEVHHDCIERFLVLEGSCTISFGDSTYALKEGDVLHVPLHHSHLVRVTSNITCKLIVQRTAA